MEIAGNDDLISTYMLMWILVNIIDFFSMGTVHNNEMKHDSVSLRSYVILLQNIHILIHSMPRLAI